MDEKQYTVVDGTYFDSRTNPEVIKILVKALASRNSSKPMRLRLYYGAIGTGRDWGDKYDTCGYIGRSTGSIKIPLLIHNRRSSGGGGILDHCIIRIDESKGGKVLYQHPTYHVKKD